MEMWRKQPRYLDQPSLSRSFDAGAYQRAFTWAGPRPRNNNVLVGPGLDRLSKQTDRNLQTLKGRLMKVDPCYEYGVEHWHMEKTRPKSATPKDDVPPAGGWPNWENRDVLFASTRSLNELDRMRTYRLEDEQSTASMPAMPGPFNKYCYLCTTLEEHEKHLLRTRELRLKKKPMTRKKHRVTFIAPSPTVAKKPKSPVPEKEEILYKVVVKTGKHPRAGLSADAKVFLQMKGVAGGMKRRQLTKNRIGFHFGQGTEETFHFKGPHIGDLQRLTLEHDGVERKHLWQVESVEVTNLSTETTWIFRCGQVLSLWKPGIGLKVTLNAELKEIVEKEYEVYVTTGDLAMAGTDANVSITLYGRRGNSEKMKLNSKDRDCFEQGETDTFQIKVKDIGPLTRLRIEHDNKGRGPGWFLEKVVVVDTAEPRSGKWYFYCKRWLADDEDDGAICRELYASKKPTSDRDNACLISYDVEVRTGDVFGAGTNAQVFIQMVGEKRRTREVKLDYHADYFEQGKTDVFEIEGEDVGKLKKVRMRHDNSGLGAGWFLDKVTVRRYLPKEETLKRIQKMVKQYDTGASSNEEDSDEEEEKEDENKEEELEEEEKSMKKKKKRNNKKKPSDRIPVFKNKGAKNMKHHFIEGHNARPGTAKKKVMFSYDGLNVTHTDTEDEDDEENMMRRMMRRKKKDPDADATSDGSESSSGDEEDKKKGKKKRGLKKEDKKVKSILKSRKNRSMDDDDDDDKEGEDEKQLEKMMRKLQSGEDIISSDDDDGEEDKNGTENSSKRNQRKKVGKAKEDDRSEEDDSVDDVSALLKRLRKYQMAENPDALLEGIKVPYYDETIFPCQQWLADDEGDGQISRELPATTPKPHFKYIKLKHNR